ncbi:ribosome small subunit-dependent GTPase A [Bdellovibrionota bacterium FG-2]
MSKYRGGSDDWLDDQRSVKRSAKKKTPSSRATLSAEQANAVVIEVFPKLCKVRMIESSAEYLCHYRRARIFRAGENLEEGQVRERTPVAVGDRVVVGAFSGENGVVEAVTPRRNRLSRPAPGGSEAKMRHVLAANVDLLVVVCSIREPDFSPGLVDRFLIAAQAQGIPVVLCLNKIDLRKDESTEVLEALYTKLAARIFEISAKKGSGVSELLDALRGSTAVFCGHSGVGKTTLLRALLQREVGRVGEIISATGKGRHTTTSAAMFSGPDQSYWIDTPGIKDLGLEGVTEESLLEYFPDLNELECSTQGCKHNGETTCVADATGDVVSLRLASYHRILKSLTQELDEV